MQANILSEPNPIKIINNGISEYIKSKWRKLRFPADKDMDNFGMSTEKETLDILQQTRSHFVAASYNINPW